MNNVLVTGGCGFIGGHLVKLLKDTYPGINIIVVDDLRTPGNYSIKGVKYFYTSIQDELLVADLNDNYSFAIFNAKK